MRYSDPTLKWFVKMCIIVGLDSSDSGWGPVLGSSEYGNEYMCLIKDREFECLPASQRGFFYMN
jgi:hypothetical protein